VSVLVATVEAALAQVVARCLEDAGFSVVEASRASRVDDVTALVAEPGAWIPPGLPEDFPVVALVPERIAQALADPLVRRASRVLHKPFSTRALEGAVRGALARSQARALRVIAEDSAMQRVVAALDAHAGDSLSLVLAGEPGTGKTHLARWLHRRSARAHGPLVEVDCAPSRDAGGLDTHSAFAPGALERAHAGTLLLEEVGSLSRHEQLGLLRFLVDGVSPRGVASDTRLIATTRRGLSREVAEGRLHPDLALRLDGRELTLPPLRARSDLFALAELFFADAALSLGTSRRELDAASRAEIQQRTLQGNLHELEALARRAHLLPHTPISLAQPEIADERLPRAEELHTLDLRRLERDAIARALSLTRGNRRLAARALGIHERTLRNKLRDANS
jgi:two-component system response regulator FlrC